MDNKTGITADATDADTKAQAPLAGADQDAAQTADQQPAGDAYALKATAAETDEQFRDRILAASAASGDGVVDATLEAEVSAAEGEALDAIGQRFELTRAAALDAEAERPKLTGTEDGGEPPEAVEAAQIAALVAHGVPEDEATAMHPNDRAQALLVLEGRPDPNGAAIQEADGTEKVPAETLPLSDAPTQAKKAETLDPHTLESEDAGALAEQVGAVAQEAAADIEAGRVQPEPAPVVQARGLIRTSKLTPEDAAKAKVKTFAHAVAQLAALAGQTGDVVTLLTAQRDEAAARGDDNLASILTDGIRGLSATQNGIAQLLAEF